MVWKPFHALTQRMSINGSVSMAKKDLWCYGTRFCSHPWHAGYFWQNVGGTTEKMPNEIYGWCKARRVTVRWVAEPNGCLDSVTFKALLVHDTSEPGSNLDAVKKFARVTDWFRWTLLCVIPTVFAMQLKNALN